MNNCKDAFLALVRAGLWEKDARLSQCGDIDYNEVFQMAVEQAVVGLVAAGIEHVVDVKVPQEVALQFVGNALQLEKMNLAMNGFVEKLISQLRENDIDALLVKGQGIAQCYERPLWRACGDVDLLLGNDNYNKAKAYLLPLASSVEEEATKALHLGMTIDSWIVELHGTLRSCYMPKMDNIIDEVQNDVIFGRNVRLWNNGSTQVFLPSANNDVFFIFTHFLKHFFRSGIGLRQICDWCRLLWTSREALNLSLLENRIRRAGITTEWKAFAAFAVNYLGMPVESMPLYSSDKKWAKKAKKILDYVLVVGNFGHNRENIYKESNYIVRKSKAFGRRVNDAINHFSIFPIDSMSVFLRTFYSGVLGVANGK